MKDYGWYHRRFLIKETKNMRRNRAIFRTFMVVVFLYFTGHLIYAVGSGPSYPVVMDRPVY